MPGGAKIILQLHWFFSIYYNMVFLNLVQYCQYDSHSSEVGD